MEDATAARNESSLAAEGGPEGSIGSYCLANLLRRHPHTDHPHTDTAQCALSPPSCMSPHNALCLRSQTHGVARPAPHPISAVPWTHLSHALECAGIAASDLLPAAADAGGAAEGTGIAAAAAAGASEGDGRDEEQRPQGACLVDAVCSMVGAGREEGREQ